MKTIAVLPDGRAVCSRCGASDVSIRRAPRGALFSGPAFVGPRRAICDLCGQVHALRELGPYSARDAAHRSPESLGVVALRLTALALSAVAVFLLVRALS